MILENPVKLTSIIDSVQLEMLLDILRQAEIPAVVKDNSVGNYERLYMGVSHYAREVWVSEEGLTEAREILEGYFSAAGGGEEQQARESEPPDDPRSWWWTLRKDLVRVWILILVGVAVAGALFSAVSLLRGVLL